MRVGVLGPLVVQLGDGDISVPGQRQRDLLTALLLRRGTPVPPEVLLDLVWRNENELTVAVVHTAVAQCTAFRRRLRASRRSRPHPADRAAGHGAPGAGRTAARPRGGR